MVRCPACGAAAPGGMAALRAAGVRRCPRCSYQGEGMPYFRRAGHLALLVGVGLVTYGFGGLIYWLARRRHLVCPRCGLGWEHASSSLALGGPERGAAVPDEGSGQRLPSAGVGRRVFGVLLVLVATVLLVVGFTEHAAAAVAVGGALGAGGSLGFYWGWHAQQERRKAIMQGLQRKVVQLATARGGTLTVTEVAADLDLSMMAAEKVLMGMDDGFRVCSEISKEGILYYEFPEVRHRGEIGSGA